MSLENKMGFIKRLADVFRKTEEGFVVQLNNLFGLSPEDLKREELDKVAIQLNILSSQNRVQITVQEKDVNPKQIQPNHVRMIVQVQEKTNGIKSYRNLAVDIDLTSDITFESGVKELKRVFWSELAMKNSNAVPVLDEVVPR